jgi:hypothetical protein
MARGMTAPAAPTSSLQKPVDLGTIPKLQVGEEAPTAATYDPTKAAAYLRYTDVARIRQETAQQRMAEQQAGREAALRLGEQLKERFAKFKSTVPGSSGIRGAMTGNRAEEARKEAAIGLIGISNGSYDDAQDRLNSDEGKAFRDLGVEPRHLMYAREAYLKGATSNAMRLEASANSASPEEAAGNVTKTRKLLGGTPRTGGQASATDRLTPSWFSGSAAAPSLSGGGPSAAPAGAAAGSGAPARKLATPAKGASASLSGGDPTDDELRAALASGIKPDNEAAAIAYIAKQRAAKAKKK